MMFNYLLEAIIDLFIISFFALAVILRSAIIIHVLISGCFSDIFLPLSL